MTTKIPLAGAAVYSVLPFPRCVVLLCREEDNRTVASVLLDGMVGSQL